MAIGPSGPPVFTSPQFQAASPQHRIDMVLAALPDSTYDLRARDIAHTPVMEIDADAMGWYVRVRLYANPTVSSGAPLCERRVVTVNLRPVRFEYPVLQKSLDMEPLQAFRHREEKGYLRPAENVGKGGCPVDKAAGYTASPDAATARLVFTALDAAAAMPEGSDVAVTCGRNDAPQRCLNPTEQLQSLARHLDYIFPQPPFRKRPGWTTYYAQNKTWGALVSFDAGRLTAIHLNGAVPPPIA